MIKKIPFIFLLNLIFFSYLEAHELNPARLILDEKENNSFNVVWKFPSNVVTKPGSIIFPPDLSEKSIRNEAKNYLLKMRAILDDK